MRHVQSSPSGFGVKTVWKVHLIGARAVVGGAGHGLMMMKMIISEGCRSRPGGEEDDDDDDDDVFLSLWIAGHGP